MGCDRKQEQAPPTPAAVSPGSPDHHAAYVKRIEPLTDALLRVETLLARPGDLEYIEYDKQMKEVDFQLLKAEPALSAQERAYPSFGEINGAMTHLEMIRHYLGLIHRGKDRAARQGMSPKQLIEAAKNVALAVDVYIPDEVTKARAQLTAAKAEIQRGN